MSETELFDRLNEIQGLLDKYMEASVGNVLNVERAHDKLIELIAALDRARLIQGEAVA